MDLSDELYILTNEPGKREQLHPNEFGAKGRVRRQVGLRRPRGPCDGVPAEGRPANGPLAATSVARLLVRRLRRPRGPCCDFCILTNYSSNSTNSITRHKVKVRADIRDDEPRLGRWAFAPAASAGG